MSSWCRSRSSMKDLLNSGLQLSIIRFLKGVLCTWLMWSCVRVPLCREIQSQHCAGYYNRRRRHSNTSCITWPTATAGPQHHLVVKWRLKNKTPIQHVNENMKRQFTLEAFIYIVLFSHTEGLKLTRLYTLRRTSWWPQQTPQSQEWPTTTTIKGTVHHSNHSTFSRCTWSQVHLLSSDGNHFCAGKKNWAFYLYTGRQVHRWKTDQLRVTPSLQLVCRFRFSHCIVSHVSGGSARHVTCWEHRSD